MAKYNDTVCGGRGDAAASRRTARQSRHAVDGNELLVQDGLFVLPCAPQAMAVTRHLVWIALAADTSSQREKAGAGGVQVHNAYTGAIVCSLTVTAVATTTTMTAMQLPAPARALCATTSHNDVPHVWVGLANGVVHVRHALTAALHAILHAHDASVTSMTEFAGLVYTASADARIVQWHSASCTVVRVFVATATHTHVPRTRVQQHEQLLSQLLHTTREGTSQTTTTTTTAQRTRTAAAVRCLYAEGGALVSGGEDGVVRVWDVGAGAVQLSAQLHKGHGVTALCRVGVTMWSGDAAGCVVVWRLRTCEVLRSATLHTCRITTLQKVGARVYSGAADGVVCICDAHSGDVLQRVALLPAVASSTATTAAATRSNGSGVVLLACPVRLTRFVLWSAGNNISDVNNSSSSGAAATTTGAEVRCWHHDEQVCMTSDHARLDEVTWLASGTSPYGELAEALERHCDRLRAHLAVATAADDGHDAVAARAWPAAQQQAHESMPDERAASSSACVSAPPTRPLTQLPPSRLPHAQVMRTTRPQSASSPWAQRVVYGNDDDSGDRCHGRGSEAYYTDVSTPSAVPDTALANVNTRHNTSSPLSAAAPHDAVALAQRRAVLDQRARAAEARAADAEAALRGYLDQDAQLQRDLDDTTARIDAALRELRALAPAAAEQLLASPPFASSPSAAATPSAGAAAATSAASPSQPPPPPSASSTQPLASLLTSSTVTAASPAALTPPSLTAAAAAATSTSTALSPATTDAHTSAAAAQAATTSAAAAAADAQAAGLATVARVLDATWDGVAWTNPNVGNYIQRRYYGAQPSLRTPALRARQRRQARLPDVTLQPLPLRPRSTSSAAHAADNKDNTKDKRSSSSRGTTVTRTMTRGRTTQASDEAASAASRPRTTAAAVRPHSAVATTTSSK